MSGFDMPRIQFATASDGVRIACADAGQGTPLLRTPDWVSHLELDWQGVQGEFYRRLARSFRLIMFDGRGTGLSDRRVEDVSLEARLRDIEAVVDQLGLERFALFGLSQWSPVAMTYAARHPERVSVLILYSPFCGAFVGQDMKESAALPRALIDLIRAEWGVGARTTMNFVHPDADREEERQSLFYLRESSTGDIAARILEEGMFEVDVCDLLPDLRMPALVLHRRNDHAVPPECGRHVAALLPSARFVPLEGDHHIVCYGDAGAVVSAIEEFLGVEPVPAAPVGLEPEEPRRRVSGPPVTILFTDMAGSTTLTGRLGDVRAQALLRTHDSVVRGALRAYGGREVKHTGDGIMASFPSASGALESAIEIQRQLATHNDEREEPVRVRIGLNAGEPVEEQGDLFGTAVQLARRICELAEPGQILTSNVVRELAAGKGLLFSDCGETALRGFEDPVRLFEARWSQDT